MFTMKNKFLCSAKFLTFDISRLLIEIRYIVLVFSRFLFFLILLFSGLKFWIWWTSVFLSNSSVTSVPVLFSKENLIEQCIGKWNIFYCKNVAFSAFVSFNWKSAFWQVLCHSSIALGILKFNLHYFVGLICHIRLYFWPKIKNHWQFSFCSLALNSTRLRVIWCRIFNSDFIFAVEKFVCQCQAAKWINKSSQYIMFTADLINLILAIKIKWKGIFG